MINFRFLSPRVIAAFLVGVLLLIVAYSKQQEKEAPARYGILIGRTAHPAFGSVNVGDKIGRGGKIRNLSVSGDDPAVREAIEVYWNGVKEATYTQGGHMLVFTGAGTLELKGPIRSELCLLILVLHDDERSELIYKSMLIPTGSAKFSLTLPIIK
jgi:hypothetical protein